MQLPLTYSNFVSKYFLMENYIVSARKYRPSTFRSVVGQQALTHTLKSAIDSDRLAHAYLFCGPRGVGKTSCARIFAKTINCLNPTADHEACNECESCRAFNEQRSYNIVELDAASNNSVDDIRNLCEQVRIPPPIGKYRVFIIDEVHMLSTQAFNAFLKTLEEPPAHAIFILATTEKHKVIPTILSRCQIYDFARITVPDIVEQLTYIAQNENIKAEPAALNVIAQKADGSMRDALSIFDQVAASSEGSITYQSTIENLNVLDHEYYFKLVDLFIANNVPQTLLTFKEIRDKGFEAQFFINGLAEHLRNLMVASTPATKCLLETTEDVANQFVVQAAKLSPRFFYKALDICNQCDLNYRATTNKLLLVELTLIKLCQLFDTTPPAGDDGGNNTIKKVQPSNGAPQAQANGGSYSSAPKASAPVQPAASSQPVAAPAPASTSRIIDTPAPKITASKIATLPNGIPMIRINNPIKKTEGDKVQESKSSAGSHRNNSFTDEDLLKAWYQFIDEHPNEQIVINTMRVSLPKKIEDTLFEIEVENQGQVSFINAHKSEIINFLRNKVSNDMLAFNIKIRQGGEAPKFWSPAEIITNLRLRNPAIDKLVKDFELGLA